jgi:hypothetical protein
MNMFDYFSYFEFIGYIIRNNWRDLCTKDTILSILKLIIRNNWLEICTKDTKFLLTDQILPIY